MVHSTMFMYRRELWYAISLFCSTVIPAPEKRIPITPRVILLEWPLHFIPFVFLAYLARRPDTHLIRLLLFPLTCLCSLHFGFGYQYLHPILNVYNYAIALLSVYMLGRIILWTFTPEGMVKYTEDAPGVPRKPETNTPPAKHAANGLVEVEFDLKRKLPYNPYSEETLSRALKDAFELITTLRGREFKFSEGTYFPPEWRPRETRSIFLLLTLRSFLFHFLLLDILESLLKLVPGVGDPSGGSMFVATLAPIPRIALATFVHFLTGTAVLTGFSMVYALITLVAVGIFRIDPSKYPPATDRPFISQSLHEFWGKRWHQFLRSTFITLGGWPLSFILSLPFRVLSSVFPNNKIIEKNRESLNGLALLFGAFVGSGLFHEASSYAMGHGINLCGPTIIFFAAQAPLLLLERAWSKLTGHRVGGWLGRLWVWFVVIVGGQSMIDAWHTKGLGGGLVILPWISPTRLIIFPLLQRLGAL